MLEEESRHLAVSPPPEARNPVGKDQRGCIPAPTQLVSPPLSRNPTPPPTLSINLHIFAYSWTGLGIHLSTVSGHSPPEAGTPGAKEGPGVGGWSTG